MSGPSPPPAPAAPSLAPGSGSPNFIPANQAGVDSSFNSLFSSLEGGASSLSNIAPQLASLATNALNNPYGTQAQTGATTARNYISGTQVPGLQAAANQETALGQVGAPYASQILTAGFDPQNALYNQQIQQLQDQFGASNAMAGLSGPAAAGVTNQGLTNYNLNWENQQLGREATAAQGYSNLVSGSGAATQSGQSYAGAIPTATAEAGTLPYSTYNTLQTTPATTAGAVGAAGSSLNASDISALQQALSYLSGGTSSSSQFNSATNANYSDQLQAYNAQQAANNSALGGIGSLAGGAFGFASDPSASLFGQPLWGGGGGDISDLSALAEF